MHLTIHAPFIPIPASFATFLGVFARLDPQTGELSERVIYDSRLTEKRKR